MLAIRIGPTYQWVSFDQENAFLTKCGSSVSGMQLELEATSAISSVILFDKELTHSQLQTVKEGMSIST